MSQVASRLRGEGGERGVGKRVVVACAVLTPGILSRPPLILVKSELELTSHMARDRRRETLAATTDQKPSRGCVSGRETGYRMTREARSFTSLTVPRSNHTLVYSPSPLILLFYSRGYTPCTRGRPHRSRRAPIPAYTSSVDTGNRSFVA